MNADRQCRPAQDKARTWIYDPKAGDIESDGDIVASDINWTLNGYLMAAAPDMLWVLQEFTRKAPHLYSRLNSSKRCDRSWAKEIIGQLEDLAVAAIANAEGKA